MITYRPSTHFRQNLKDFDDYILVKWVEQTQTLQIWSLLPNKPPVLEHSYIRNGKRNWDMEWIVLKQLENGRRFQHETAQEFQDNMLNKRDEFRAKGEAEADEMMNSFMSDSYWHKKRLQENDDNDFGACTTKWGGADLNPEGN